MTKRMDSIAKQAQALTLRKAGVSVTAIAEMLGWNSHQAASKAIRAALKRTIQEPADELRTLELSRLDDMLKAIAPHVAAGNLTAIDRALKIMERRAKLIGLDAPAKHDVTTGGEKIKGYIGWTPDEWNNDKAQE
jgi:DNA-binding transcriptional MerR regulator